MITGTFNQRVEWSAKFGGIRKVFEGQVKILVGGFAFDLADLPEPGAVLPAGTPVYCDEVARTIKPLVTVKATAVTGSVVTVEAQNGSCALKVGQTVVVAPNNLSSAGTNLTISKIEQNTAGNFEVTLSAVTGISANTVLMVSDEDGKVVTPNTLLPYDVVRDEKAVAVDGDGAWAALEFPVLENRMPPITAAVKTALVNAGCFFRFSSRK